MDDSRPLASMPNSLEIVGRSQHHSEFIKFIDKAAITEANVLLWGETGVGKELAARNIHLRSLRKDKPFIKINCANLNENLLESEIFGYGKGSYTGALIDKPGLIEEADQGIFFLDEIADISIHLQAKLLSVIEDCEFRRIGENKIRTVNVKYIFATNKDLQKLMLTGKFRYDLFYRICVFSFEIFPLRKRKSDIPVLIKTILKKESDRVSHKIRITKSAMEKLIGHSFPGNVRELENIIKRAVILSDDSVLDCTHIQFNQFQTEKRCVVRSRYSADEIINALVKHNGNKTKAAKELGISRVHFYRIMGRLKDNM